MTFPGAAVRTAMSCAAAAKGQCGDAVCTGGCVKAQASLCTALTC